MKLPLALLAGNLAALALSIIFRPGTALPWISGFLLVGTLYFVWLHRQKRARPARRPPSSIARLRDRGKVIPFPGNQRSRFMH